MYLLSYHLFYQITRGRAAAARVAHNHKVGGSSPPPATKKNTSPAGGVFFFCIERLEPIGENCQWQLEESFGAKRRTKCVYAFE